MKKYFFLFFFIILFAASAHSAKAAKLFWLPTNLNISQGQDMLVELYLTAEPEENINALDIEVNWPAKNLILQEVSRGGSQFDLWVSPEQQQSQNSFSLVAGASQPLPSGDNLVARFYFQGKNPGPAQITIDKSAEVLLADGQATAAPVELFPGNYQVIAKELNQLQLSSRGMPDQNRWYQLTDFDIHWTTQIGWQYSYILTQDPTQVPDQQAEEIVGDIKYENLPDGIYYFQIIPYSPEKGWQNVSTYRAMIDSSAPVINHLSFVDDPEYQIKNSLVFTAGDDFSGLSHFQIKENGNEWQRIASPVEVGNLWFGQKKFTVQAIDKAGNTAQQEVWQKGIFGWYHLILVLLALLILIYIFLHKSKNV